MSFSEDLVRSLETNRITRRQALWLMGVGALSASSVSLQGCAASPVTGKQILVGMSEGQEREVDAQVSPHQFSQDLGAVQDASLNNYVAGLGRDLHSRSHRPNMPYSYRVLNANYVNAYTFPGGAMGLTRGIVTELNNEAELAALLGHEIAHVNARHAAQRQGQALLAEVAIVGVNIAVADSEWGVLAEVGSQIGASALLSSYSRDNEREADALGQEYMVRAGYPATGMTALHQMLVSEEKSSPSLLETMFSSHPMSVERRDTARHLAATKYASSASANPRRERFMDNTAGLRKIKPTIDACKNGETAMAKEDLNSAERQFQTALKQTPNDYAANIRMAQCQEAKGNHKRALQYANTARRIYPQEAQAHKIVGAIALSQRDPETAYASLQQFNRLLPGDPGVTFMMGVSAEGMGNRRVAARHYSQYLQMTQEGEAAQFSYDRLKSWGLMR